ncbi:MAG: SH3 domain-containing protein [Rhodospirillales bacterium]
MMGMLAVGMVGMLSADVLAADMDFMGTMVTPAPGRYLVEKDANVRASPETEGKRVAGVSAGQIIEIAGRAGKTAWLAVVQKGKPLGFIYETVLSPIIDGEIINDVTGEIRLGVKHRCGYRVHFVGKASSDVGTSSQALRAADYEVNIVCERNGVRIRFPAQMFMTEVPFDGSNKRQVFQINVDLLDGVHGLPDVFSTITMFDLDKGEVRFDSVSEASYARKSGALESLPSTNVERALSSALEIAMTRWSDKAWDDIFKQAI